MGVRSEGDNAFGVYRVFFWFIGVWPLEKKNYFKIFRFSMAIIFQASFLMHSLAELYLNNGKISDIVDILLFFASALLSTIKHIFLNIHGDKIAENLKCYTKDWTDVKDETSLKVMRAHVKIYKYQHIIYNSVGYIGTTLFLTRTILLNFINQRQLGSNEEIEYQLISHTSYISQEFLTKYYIILIIIQYAQCIYVCTCGACTDCFFFGLVFHLCAQFEILKLEWEKLGVDDSNDRNTVESNDLKIKVNILVIKHQKLIKLGKNLEESFNGVVLIQLLISIILICMSGCSILVAMMVRDYMTILLSTNCISFMISESFIYAYASDYLLSQSESIVQAAYSSGWYNLENRLKRNFIFIIMKAQNPLYITAGKFFYITRNTAIQLLKSTFSYISVLRLTFEVSHTNI
ncbi:PREDICTED: odorant receptor 4-like [Ceratosolen solmsi marchali]|uniref:Odorant receptor n=1 Tax=Ceratosolen solmsi marchali TaxID=326594 RepID=A0AAJ6YIX5_9HYME|nr:PREDICTED: odorant receptor 4-like [Ceratosolen solmsi marchali]